jgi:hypothetical protein
MKVIRTVLARSIHEFLIGEASVSGQDNSPY